MKSPAIAAAALLAASAAAQPAAAPRAGGVPFAFDKTHSHVGFKVKHLGVSYVKGSFGDFEAEIEADEATGKLTKVKGVVKTGSVDTGSQKRDAHLKAEDFFAAEKYPAMRLETRRIRWDDDTFVAHAMLTIRDKTRPVIFRGELTGTQTGTFWGKKQIRAGYSATTKIDRKKFGLLFNGLAEGVAMVGDKVTITLEVEAYRNLE